MIKATTSITTKMIKYCASWTAKEKRGSTKKKSNNSTLAKAATMPAVRPNRIATSATTSR